jgi:glycosyltransferase involved in cell wall biosynthesis
MKASVIVPAYNAASTLPECLEGLLTQQGQINLEIIVVDDGSTDATAAVARRYTGQGVKLLQQTNAGAAAARNTGIRAARPDSAFILFTDADCIPCPDWANRLAQALSEAEPQVAGIKGAYSTRQTSPVARFVQTEFEERYERFIRHRLSPDFADTYSAAYRPEILQKYPFDESLPGAIVEDAELGWRLRQLGYTFGFAPQALVYHRHPEHFGFYFRRKFRIGRWRVAIYRRYPGQLSSRGHTSQLAQLQMALLLLSSLSLSLAALIRLIFKPGPARWFFRNGWIGCFILQASYVNSLFKLWRKDRNLVIAAWALLNLRTLALTGGAIAGVGQLVLEKFKGR